MLHEQGSPFSSWSEKKEAPFWERVGFPSVVELDILIRQLQTKLRNDRVRPQEEVLQKEEMHFRLPDRGIDTHTYDTGRSEL
jgi:hypothetical protein